MKAVQWLVRLLVSPDQAAQVPPDMWPAVISVARAEALLGTLAHRLSDAGLPEAAARTLADARAAADTAQRAALWEAEMAWRALGDIPFVLLKGTAYAAADLAPAAGRQIGDLDILVARGDLAAAEPRLLAAGWEWVKPDPYDDAYYRQWMHELPPLIHRERDRMIDVHHTIIPLTARPSPDPARMMARAQTLDGGLMVLHPHDRIIHAAAHLFADGDLQGGLRNLWDIHGLLSAGGFDPARLRAEAVRDGLGRAVDRAARLSNSIFGTSPPWPDAPRAADRWFKSRLLARDDWGRQTHKGLGGAFYIRSHLLRMPPMMLARHLWTKWRRGKGLQA